MVELALRDDDLNFFSKVEDIENVYSEISSFPVTFAVIPEVIDVSTKARCPETKGNTTPHWVGDNVELVSWMKKKLIQRQADVCLHGITHGYQFIGGKRYAEMEWRKEENLALEITEYKTKLQDLLNYPISVFVAPSNKISRYGINCVAKAGLNYSGIVPASFQRDLTVKNIANYLKRWWIRAVDKLPYPAVMQYSTHKEINACLLQGYDYLVKMYNYCDKYNYPMAVNVHYWHLRDNPKELETLVRFVNYALERGAKPTTLSELLK